MEIRQGDFIYIVPKTMGDLGTKPELKTESSEPTKDIVDKPKIDDATKDIEPKPEPKDEPKDEPNKGECKEEPKPESKDQAKPEPKGEAKPEQTPKSLDLGSRSAA